MRTSHPRVSVEMLTDQENNMRKSRNPVEGQLPLMSSDQMWQRQVPVPKKTAAVLALIQMGVTSYTEIARAVGLSVDEVARIDAAEDKAVRQLATGGFPKGTYVRLQRKTRCPKCNSLVNLVPCVACDVGFSSPC